jgi:hypothetical protein
MQIENKAKQNPQHLNFQLEALDVRGFVFRPIRNHNAFQRLYCGVKRLLAQFIFHGLWQLNFEEINFFGECVSGGIERKVAGLRHEKKLKKSEHPSGV